MESTASTQSPERRDYRDKLRAAALQASSLLTAGAEDKTVPAILATFGQALSVDRILVLENRPSEGGVALCYCWQQPGVPQVTPASFCEYPLTSEEMRQWLAPLAQGKHVAARRRQASGALADLFRKLDMQSILIVPIVIGDQLWGSVGVDACATEREWRDAEVELLKITANLIGITIIRDRYIGLLQTSEQKFRAFAEAALDAMIVIDSSGFVQYWNPAAQRILGYSPEEAAGKRIHEWLAPERYHQAATVGMNRFLAVGGSNAFGHTQEFAALRKDGVEIPIELSVAPFQVAAEWCAIGILRDITARREAEQRIVWLARHDGLTSLPNRAVFISEIEQAILRYRRWGERFAVFYLDLDHFKDVNDTLGHRTGDLLLKQAAERLRGAIRNSDLIARFGGDEFAILTPQLSDATDAGILASKLVAEMSRPFLIAGSEVHTGTSIGIATCNHEDTDAEALLAHADVALYRAKSEEGNTFRFFTDELQDDVLYRINLLRELRRAIEQEELMLFYQPQVDMRSLAIVGLEALVRWQHPRYGLIPSSRFIATAERSGLTIALGEFVLERVCREARIWIDLGIQLPTIAVNISPTQFKAATQLQAVISRVLLETQLPPGLLEIEITETALMQVTRNNNDFLQHVRSKGIRIAIDEFGTGCSCLDYLRRSPVSRLKIARSFIADITHSPSSAAVTRAVIGLGRELGVSLLAQGVETAEQVGLLTQWGCDHGQGFYFARPLPPQKIIGLLQAGRLPAVPSNLTFPTAKPVANAPLHL